MASRRIRIRSRRRQVEAVVVPAIGSPLRPMTRPTRRGIGQRVGPARWMIVIVIRGGVVRRRAALRPDWLAAPRESIRTLTRGRRSGRRGRRSRRHLAKTIFWARSLPSLEHLPGNRACSSATTIRASRCLRCGRAVVALPIRSPHVGETCSHNSSNRRNWLVWEESGCRRPSTTVRQTPEP